MLLLELFCGTKSVGKVFEEKGYKVISLDNRKKTDPTYCVDILEWDGYKNIEMPIPDFIWASPPCTTFSIASGGRHRTKADMIGFTEDAKIGIKILQKTLEIIKYFEEKNPKLKWAFENPRGLMRYTEEVKDILRSTCCYCKYDHCYKKPTDIFSNFPLELLMCREKRGEKTCHHRRGNKGIHSAKLNDKFKIPSKLIEYILEQI